MKKLLSLVFFTFLSVFVFAERPIVRNIQAIAGKGTKINIFWTLPQNPDQEITKLLVYRDTKPISSFDNIELLDPIAQISPDFTGYTDSVKDYNEYYYSVIAVTTEPYDLVLASINSTIIGVHLSIPEKKEPENKKNYEKLYPDGKMRETPLPIIDLIDGVNEDSTISDKTVISTKAFSATQQKSTPLMSLYIFEEDLISPDGGDDYLLFEILKTHFVQKQYTQAITQLNKLVGTNINEKTRNRAYFYIGEAQYLSANYSEAIRSFVKIQHEYPNLTKKWIDSALDRI